MHVVLTMLYFPCLLAPFQFCASSPKEAEEWVKQIDFVLKGQRFPLSLRNGLHREQKSSSLTCSTFCWIVVVPASADMTGIIPLDEEEEHEQELYDDVGAIDDDIYEVLPGLPACLPACTCSTRCVCIDLPH